MPNCNRGLHVANGEWVKLIAGDDKLLNNCIEDNILYINHNKDVMIVFSISILFKSIENKNVQLKMQPLEHQKIWYEKAANEQYFRLLKGNFNWTTPTSFISLKLLKEMDYFDARFEMFEDYPMWLKVTKFNFKLYYFDKPTVMYRQSESITRVKNNWVNEKYFEAYSKHFISEVGNELKLYDFNTYILKRLYIFRIYVLIKLLKTRKMLFHLRRALMVDRSAAPPPSVDADPLHDREFRPGRRGLPRRGVWHQASAAHHRPDHQLAHRPFDVSGAGQRLRHPLPPVASSSNWLTAAKISPTPSPSIPACSTPPV